MIYQKFLNLIRKKNYCPFCNLDKNFVIKANSKAILTLARAPYVKDHLLVFPKRHIMELKNLKNSEKIAIGKLIIWGIDKLHTRYPGVEIEYKEGELNSAGKSINHLHVHIVPKKKARGKIPIDKRNFYSDKVLLSKITKIKKEFSKK